MASDKQGKIVFVGDEVSALGFRLAGVETRVPGVDELESVLSAAEKDAALVIVTAELARSTRTSPKRGVRLVIADAKGSVFPPDFAQRVRRELGILS